VVGGETFGEDVGNLVNGGEVVELNVFVENLFSDEVDVNFDVLGSGMGDRIGGNGKGARVITPNCGRRR
jgi:hypothetical protein